MRVGFLLRPGWLALTAGVLVFAAACFTVLAPWQFGRNTDKRELNAAVRASFELPPAPLDTLPPDTPEWRQVMLTGSYLAEAEVVARLRSVHGEPAFEVLTPMRLTSGAVVLVNRGFVRPERGNQVPGYAAPPAGEVTVVGRLRLDEGGADRPPVTDGGRVQVYAVNSTAVALATGVTGMRPGYVQLNADQPGVLAALPLPRLEAGPHLSYGLQWLVFGVMALVGWVVVVRRELAERRELASRRAAATGE